MYSYIIDPQKIPQKAFERVQNELYATVSELRISGEMSRVTSLRSVSQLVDTAIERGATTIVAVGHDSTVQEVINAVESRGLRKQMEESANENNAGEFNNGEVQNEGDDVVDVFRSISITDDYRDVTKPVQEKEIAIGYVPIQESELTGVLGITNVRQACQTLAQRRVELLDLGQVHYQKFFTKLAFGNNWQDFVPKSVFDFSKFSQASGLKPIPIKMEIDGQINVEFEVAIGAIFNSRSAKGQAKIADPTDGVLDILMLPGITSYDAWKYRTDLATGSLENIPGCAVIHGKRIVITSPEGLSFYVGDKTVAKAPTVIEVLPKKVRMVVGKDRTF